MKHARKTPWYRVDPAIFIGALLIATIVACSALSANDAMNTLMAQMGTTAETPEITRTQVPTAAKLAQAVPAVPEDQQEKQEEQQDENQAEAQTLDWRAPTGNQPDLSQYANLSIDVSIADQKVYIKSGDEVIYTMIASTGVYDTTPLGDFWITTRGTHFYNASEGMGADYWVTFYGTAYLFHSVPTTDVFGDYIESEALKLGTPASHGCVRLTVADAKWFYEQIPSGVPVHIG